MNSKQNNTTYNGKEIAEVLKKFKIMDYKIKQCTKDCRFEIEFDKDKAYIEYIDNGDSLTITHTFVPKELTGKGVAAELTKKVIEYAKNSNKQLNATCPYAVRYLNK